MLVQYKDPARLEGYCPLAPDILYRVLAISSSLKFQSSDVRALLWDPTAKSTDSGVVFPWFVPFRQLEVVESLLPDEWSTYYFNENINTPTLIHSFKEMSDLDFFIRVNDLNTEDPDNQILHGHLSKYGGNIKLSEEQNRMRSDEYQRAEVVVDRYRKDLQEYYVSDGAKNNIIYSYQDYCDNLRVVLRTIIDRLAMLESGNSQRIFLEQLRGLTSFVGARNQTGDPADYKELIEINNDLKYPYDFSSIVKKIKAKRYKIQQKQFQIHEHNA